MIKKTITIINENGLDVKVITKIVNISSSFISDINFCVSSNVADAKSIINLMALNVKQNDELTIVVSGKDETNAFESIIGTLKECQII